MGAELPLCRPTAPAGGPEAEFRRFMEMVRRESEKDEFLSITEWNEGEMMRRWVEQFRIERK
jgi:hypothetical protein